MVRSTGSPPGSAQSDEALVAATLRGDREAYRSLVERYQDRMLRMALDVVKNQQDAEDIVQESFVKAFLSLDKFKGQSSFFTWLYRITYNMAVDHKRRMQRRGGQHFEYKEQIGVSSEVGPNQTESDSELFPSAQNVEGPHEALVRKQTGSKLERAFAQLSEEHRAVITLREIDGLDYEEIATALGIPRGTVMSRLFYARKVLQRALREIAPDDATEDTQANESEIAIRDSDNEKGQASGHKRLKRAPG
jgi:RNA polymerase sigma-70 factor (ECF subfamily)